LVGVHSGAECVNDVYSSRNVKPLVAQLMRIHVVTPKAPIHVTLNPRVHPAPSPCPVFVTGCEQPLRLSQSAYWVLRLPYPFVHS
jgi:protein SMG8